MPYPCKRRSPPVQPAERLVAQCTPLERSLFEAVVTAGAAVAIADGRVDPSERAALLTFIDSGGCLPNYSSSEMASAFDSRIQEFQLLEAVFEAVLSTVSSLAHSAPKEHPQQGWNRRKRAAAEDTDFRIGSTSSNLMLAIRVAEHVASADGWVHDSERRVLDLIRLTAAPRLAGMPL